MRNLTFILRDLAVLLAFPIGCVAGGVVGAAGGFYGLYGICRAVSWLAGSDRYMHLMWVGIVVVPLLALAGVGAGGVFTASLVAIGLRDRQQEQRGFEVSTKSGAAESVEESAAQRT
jgi:hypothetical protein